MGMRCASSRVCSLAISRRARLAVGQGIGLVAFGALRIGEPLLCGGERGIP